MKKGKTYKPSKKFHKLMNSPEVLADVARMRRREERVQRVFGWTKRIPVVGPYVNAFWFLIFTEGIRSTCKPRWGGITFAFLNDGMKPTLWHTWRQVTRSNEDKYTGIYPGGAPVSLAEAQAWEEKWEAERAANDQDL